jgi:hypothetical protein
MTRCCIGWAEVLAGGARDAAALARFLDEPRETFGTQVRIADRDQDDKVVGSRDAHVWHTSLSLHPDEPALPDERWGEIAVPAERARRRSSSLQRCGTRVPPWRCT